MEKTVLATVKKEVIKHLHIDQLCSLKIKFTNYNQLKIYVLKIVCNINNHAPNTSKNTKCNIDDVIDIPQLINCISDNCSSI